MASSPSSQVYIVEDDEDGNNLNLGPQPWSADVEDFYFGDAKRVVWPGFSFNASSLRGSFSYNFDGTEIRIVGPTANVGATQVFQVTIDNNSPYNTSTDDDSPEHYRQWYQSPPLNDGPHHVSFDLLDGQGIDYIVVTPGPQSSLTDATLMIDDTYNGIKYSSGWQTVQNSTYVKSSIIPGNSFMNTTHQTSTIGDSFTFSYTGTNFSIYGNFLWEKVGGLTVTYNIDGGSNFTQTYQSDGTNPIEEEPNFKFVDTGYLAPGNHTVALTLTDCINQTLVLDYILYTPSFNTLASMPNLTASNPSSTGQTSPTASSSGSKSHVGAIAGGVVGGVAFIAILIALVFFWLRRRRSNLKVTDYSETEQFSAAETPAMIIEPFSASAPSSSFGNLSPTPMMTKQGATSGSVLNLSYYNPTSPGTPATELPSVAGSSSPTTAVTGVPPKRYVQNPGDVDELRRHIHELTEENRSLAAMHAPPAYSDVDREMEEGN